MGTVLVRIESIGSSIYEIWGIEVMTAVRDNMEATLRGIMAHSPVDGSAKVPEYNKKAQ